MSYVTAAFAITAAVIAAVGSGITAYSQQQQAKNQEAMARYNYAIQQQQAELNARVSQQQAIWQQEQDQAQYTAQQNNATTIENQARAIEAQGRAEADRMREANERRLATQRAHYAASGVTSEGSPLAVMADSAGLLELGVQDKAFQTDLQSRELMQKAADERFQSGFSLRDARLQQYHSAVAQADLRLGLLKTEGTLSSGLAEAQFTRNDSAQTIVSGVKTAASSVGSAIK